MKYIITESRLNEFIIQYLDSWLSTKYLNGFDAYISITSRDEMDDIEDEVYMEYDYEDGRLYVNRDFRKLFMDLFNKTSKDANSTFKDWFEYKFGEKVEYVD